MKTYPHATPDGIIELVRKDEHDAVAQELNERLTKQQADMLDTIVDLRRQIALAVSGYIVSTEVTSNLLKDVKTALAGGVAHARSRLELALTRYSKEFNELTLCPEMPSIKTDVRLFDLVRYMRSELHKANLITDDEYAWLLSANPGEPSADGSPSRERLETYDELRTELTRWQSLAEKLATEIDCLTHVIGLTPLAGNKRAMQESFDSARKALAAYESTKSGNLPDPLADAVKRMEAVPKEVLCKAYDDAPFGETDDETWINAFEAVRARLISAAKGEQP